MDESLSYESFFEGANRSTQKAMDDHANREFDEFALHSGVAVERLAKAALVRVSPLYLVEMRNNNTDMLLYFGGGWSFRATRSAPSGPRTPWLGSESCRSFRPTRNWTLSST
ncbi:hypothetical protein [Streptomyces mirabilis]|uniref:hypothetical protein n=1 Tax=Streptomyces mirabilis TaxID=68239 RepID=UPI00369C3A5C